ncbi:ATP-binding protein [Bacteroidota bacterium]
MKRQIVKIDEEKCDGCGLCIPNCAEGALQVINGKARLISDLFCDGLGACLGHCPQDAISIEEREAEPYDEWKVMDYIVQGGNEVIIAHMEHLRDHEEFEYLAIAKKYLEEKNIEINLGEDKPKQAEACNTGCPGSKSLDLRDDVKDIVEDGARASHLSHWPIQLHLVSPSAGYYKDANLLLSADCVGFSYPNFHKDFLKGKSLAIACPKLDTNKEVYLEKLIAMINEAKIKSIHVMIMTVPCCGGLFHLVKEAVEKADRNIPVKVSVIGIKGEVAQEQLFN